MTETAYAMYVGIDWGTASHQVAVLDAQRVPLGERAVAHDGAAFQTFTEWLTLLAGAEPARVAVALEVPRGAVVDTLLERGFHVFALNPKQLDRFRDRQRRSSGCFRTGHRPGDRPAGLPTARARGSPDRQASGVVAGRG